MATGLLQAIFGIERGEYRKVFAFALLGGMMQAGIAVGVSTADSLFLVHVGASELPMVYLLTPLVMFAYIFLYSVLLSRYGIDVTFKTTLVILAVGGVGLGLGIESAADSGAFSAPLLYATKLYSGLWYIALYTLFWNFVDGYFDILDAKRLFSFLAAGAALGAALGGGLVSVLTNYVEVHTLLLVWSLLSIATYPVFELIRRNWAKLETTEDDADQNALSLIDQAKSTIVNFRASRFAVLIASVLFLTMSVTLVCEYQFYGAFSKGRDEAELADLFGRLFFAVNVFNLVFTLFFFNRLVALLGIRNLALIQPISYLLTFVCFLVKPGDFAAIVGFFAFHGMLTSIDYNSTNFLLNALPSRGKKQLRTFIEGICEPMANAVTGVFLIFLVEMLSPEQISTVGLSGAVACLVLVLWMRSAYVSAMVTNLKSAWLDFSRSPTEVTAALTAQECEALRVRLDSFRPGDDVSDQLLAIRLLMSHDRLYTLEAMLHILETADGPLLDEAVACLSELMRSHGPELVQRLLTWLEQKEELLDARVTVELARWGMISRRTAATQVDAADPESAAANSVVLHSSPNIRDFSASLETLEKLLNGDEAACLAAVRALGCLGSERYAQLLVGYMGSASPDVSYAALCSARELAGPQSTRLLPAVLGVLDSRDERRRLIALDCLARIGESSALSDMLDKSWSFSPDERRKAESVIASIGLRAVPVIVSELTDPGASYRARSIAARALAKLSFAQLEAFGFDLIDHEIERSYNCLVNRSVLKEHEAASPGCRTLSRFYADEERTITDFVLELLTLSGRVASFELLSASLRSSIRKERANAIETVQQACPRRVFRLFAPLLDERRGDLRRKFVQRRIRKGGVNSAIVLERALTSVHPLESAAAAQALWDARGAEAAELLRDTLRKFPSSERSSVLTSLLSRESFGQPPSETIIERIDVLSSCDFFRAFSIEDLQAIARQSMRQTFNAGETIYRAGSAADDLYVVQEGSVEISGEHGVRTLGIGEVFGSEAVFGEKCRKEEARWARGHALQVKHESVIACAAVNARAGAGLLAMKLGVTHAT